MDEPHRMAHYFLKELESLLGDGYHPAARAAVMDCAREWIIQTTGKVLVESFRVLEELQILDDTGIRSCPYCGTTFHPTNSPGPRMRYCSDNCRKLYHFRQKYPIRPNHGICQFCGESLSGRRSNAIYCGPRCKDRAYQKRKKSSNPLTGSD